MSYMASQITSISTVWSVVCSGAHRRKHQTSALLAFVRGNHRRPVNSPHKGPVTRKMFPFDDVIMIQVDEFDTKYSKPARPVIKRGIDYVLYPIPLSLNSMYVWHVSISRFNQTVFFFFMEGINLSWQDTWIQEKWNKNITFLSVLTLTAYDI